jgi:hypothetical protein
LAIYALLLHLGGLLGHVQMQEGASAGSLIYDAWFGNLAATPFHASLSALVLVFVQGFVVNVLIDQFRLLGERNWFPGLFYVLVASSVPSLSFLSAPLVAATFCPVFYLGGCSGPTRSRTLPLLFLTPVFGSVVASLFYPPAILLLIGAFAGLEVVRSFSMRERAVLLSGAFVPVFLAWAFYFWLDRGGEFRDIQFSLDLLPTLEGEWGVLQWLQAAWWSAVLMVAFLSFGGLSSRKLIQAQKSVKALYWSLTVALISSLWAEHWNWQQLLLCAPALGSILALLFASIRRKIWAEWWHFVLFAAALYFQFHALISF